MLLVKIRLASERITAAAIMKAITIIHLTETAVGWKVNGEKDRRSTRVKG